MGTYQYKPAAQASACPWIDALACASGLYSRGPEPKSAQFVVKVSQFGSLLENAILSNHLISPSLLYEKSQLNRQIDKDG